MIIFFFALMFFCTSLTGKPYLSMKSRLANINSVKKNFAIESRKSPLKYLRLSISLEEGILLP